MKIVPSSRKAGRGGVMSVYADRLLNNARLVAARLDHRLLPVLKGDAYGMGVELAVEVFIQVGVDALMVGTADEAVRATAAGFTKRVIVLDASSIAARGSHRWEWLVGEPEIADILRRRRASTALRVHLDVDFGLGRGGLPGTEVVEVLQRLARCPRVTVVGLAGQLPAAAGVAAAATAYQMLLDVGRDLPGAMVHLGGSDLLRWSDCMPAASMRVGRLLYGATPRQVPQELGTGIEPVWAWQATGTPLRPSARIGYGRRRPPSGAPLRIDVGYADGLPAQAPGCWPVRAGGRWHRIEEVFMHCCVAYPVDAGTALDGPVEVLLSGRTPHDHVPVRMISEALGVSTTAVLACPRSPRQVQR